jgi:hypothetical protein
MARRQRVKTNRLRARGERIVILSLCLLAGLRVFIYSAAFPFFSQVDEPLHFDLITQYEHARVPRSFDVLSDETLGWIVPYASPEFLHTPAWFPEGKFPTPLWKQSGPEADAIAAVTKTAWEMINFESSQPPVYYWLAAVWWRVGRLAGLNGIQSLYWIRFLNVPIFAALVWLGYVAARIVEPAHVDLRIGVPLLLAFLPQNVFYSMNNDVLMPICGGALFLCVLRWLQVQKPTLLLGVGTGLAFAAAYLTKIANLPLLLVASIAIGAKTLFMLRHNRDRVLLAFAALVFCAAIPIVGWMMWMRNNFGDLTGSTTKIILLGWTNKPFAEWWHHPIFTIRGLSIFWSELLATFWRGELKWQDQPLHWSVADGFYAISSVLLICAAAIGLRKRTGSSGSERRTIALALGMFTASIAFLALLSIQFDFGDNANPSRAHPYFTNGRLMMGALIPFALVYVYGVAYLLRRVSAALPLILMAAIVVFVSGSEVLINRVAFTSEHNWFHR